MKKILDVHCHVFNADDLPIRNFISAYARGIPIVVAEIVEKILQTQAPDDKAARAREPVDLSDAVIKFKIKEVLGKNPPIEQEYLEEKKKYEIAGEDRGISGDFISLVTHYAKWAYLMTNARGQIALLLSKTFPDVVGFVPMLMDMEIGLGEKPSTCPEKQIDILSKMALNDAGRWLPFVAFDPRHPIDQSMQIIEDAIYNKGFVGVKIYPPMCYRPSCNSETFPTPSNPKKLDDAFFKLLTWCKEHDVPITTHASKGGAEAANGSGINADPAFWGQVLTELNGGLRLNFAHFGDDESFATGARSSWGWKIGAMIERYKNHLIYTDMAHHTGIMKSTIRTDFFKNLKDLASECPSILSRLMYGSDYHMIVRAMNFSTYLKDLHSYYQTEFDEHQLDLFFRQNAINFLGLRKGQRTRDRLENTYKKAGKVVPSWWDE